MSSAVNPLEWILPPVALSHMALDAAGVKINTPGSPNTKRSAGEAQASREADIQKQRLGEQHRAQQQRLSDAEPMNVRRRAEASARALGETGRRTASQLLSGL